MLREAGTRHKALKVEPGLPAEESGEGRGMAKLALARAPRRRDRRTTIIAAAAEVWNAQGARGFTVAAVARLVGLPPVSVTHYFRTRDELATECMLDTVARVTVMAREA